MLASLISFDLFTAICDVWWNESDAGIEIYEIVENNFCCFRLISPCLCFVLAQFLLALIVPSMIQSRFCSPLGSRMISLSFSIESNIFN